jgi:hypothetical protein
MNGVLMQTRTATVSATSTTAVFTPLTGWMPTVNITQLRCVVSVVNRTTNLQVTLGIQSALVDPENANAPAACGAAISTAGRTFRDVDVTQAATGNVNANMWFRIGVLAASTGATVETGTVAVTPSFKCV